MNIKLYIYWYNKNIIYDKNVTHVEVPGSQGRFQIFYNHNKIISILIKGIIKIFKKNNQITFNIKSGLIYIKTKNKINIIVS